MLGLIHRRVLESRPLVVTGLAASFSSFTPSEIKNDVMDTNKMSGQFTHKTFATTVTDDYMTKFTGMRSLYQFEYKQNYGVDLKFLDDYDCEQTLAVVHTRDPWKFFVENIKPMVDLAVDLQYPLNKNKMMITWSQLLCWYLYCPIELHGFIFTYFMKRGMSLVEGSQDFRAWNPPDMSYWVNPPKGCYNVHASPAEYQRPKVDLNFGKRKWKGLDNLGKGELLYGFGSVIRDEKGDSVNYFSEVSDSAPGLETVTESEVEAMLRAVMFCHRNRYLDIVLHSNNLYAVSLVNQQETPNSYALETKCSEILRYKKEFNSFRVKFIRSQINNLAHELAQSAVQEVLKENSKRCGIIPVDINKELLIKQKDGCCFFVLPKNWKSFD